MLPTTAVPEMSSRVEMFAYAAAAVAAGTIYVLVHESRRKRKKAERLERDAPISKEVLLQILNMAADKSKAVIDQVRARPAACRVTAAARPRRRVASRSGGARAQITRRQRAWSRGIVLGGRPAAASAEALSPAAART